MGFAVAELSLGVLDSRGRLIDAMRHGASNRTQTAIYVSSTDPWHRAVDRDRGLEQPGFDRVFQKRNHARASDDGSPWGALYDTPANAAAEIRFLQARGYPFRQVELGEEPDGQNQVSTRRTSPNCSSNLRTPFMRSTRGLRRVVPAFSRRSQTLGWTRMRIIPGHDISFGLPGGARPPERSGIL